MQGGFHRFGQPAAVVVTTVLSRLWPGSGDRQSPKYCTDPVSGLARGSAPYGVPANIGTRNVERRRGAPAAQPTGLYPGSEPRWEPGGGGASSCATYEQQP